MEKKTVNILGTEYEILVQPEKENPKLKECSGLCEQYSKKIILDDFENQKDDLMLAENFDEFKNKVLRHEVIHAYFGEAGLRSESDFAENEELVDWIAIMLPRIFKTCQELNIL